MSSTTTLRFCLDARTVSHHFPGIGRYVSNLARALDQQLAQGEELLLLVDSRQESPWSLPQPGGRLLWRDVAHSPFSLRQQWTIPRYLRQEQVDLYHSPYYLMPYWSGLPTVLTIHDLIPQLFPSYVSLQARWFFRLTTKMALRRAGHIIVVSEATGRDVVYAYPGAAGRLTAIQEAPEAHFRPQPATVVTRIRQKYRLPAEYLLYLGINKPHKNLLRLLEAYRKLRDGSASLATMPSLVIAGAWDERYPEAKERVTELGLAGAVSFLGPLPDADLPGLYAGACLFVFPSLYEGFGLPVIEAMACGTAVACANTPSLLEAGGDAALYFDPADVGDMSTTIGQLLSDERLRYDLGQQGQRQATRFSWERAAAETLHIYRRLAPERVVKRSTSPY